MSERSDHPDLQRDVRSEVIGFFRLMGDEKRQQELIPDADQATVAMELCRLWFDEIYVPSERYFDSLKGDQSAEAVDHFIQNFNKEELEAMARFHRFLELRLEMITEQKLELVDSTQWQNVVKDARNTLALLTR